MIEMGPEHFVQPSRGKLVLFPAYVWHGTVPFHGGGEPADHSVRCRASLSSLAVIAYNLYYVKSDALADLA